MNTGTASRRRSVSAFGTVSMVARLPGCSVGGLPGCRVAGLPSKGCAEGNRQLANLATRAPSNSATKHPSHYPSQLRAELIECRLAEIDRLSLGQQQILFHQIVDQARHRLA